MLSIIKGPYLQRPAADRMTIMWETSEPAHSEAVIMLAERIHSGHQGNYKKPEQIVASAASEQSSTIHNLTLEGLQPGTVYFYKIFSSNGGQSVESGPHPLKTAPDRGEPFSFTVTSETGGYSYFDTSNGAINEQIFQGMSRYRPDFALFVGDIVDDGNRYSDWDNYFFGPGKSFLLSTPFYSCLGNHEDDADWFYRFFDYPAPKNYYSFNYGDAHFICLDSTAFVHKDSYPGSDGRIRPGNEQYDFLIKDLEASQAKWKIVFFHYPPYISGGYQVEDMRLLCPIFEQYGVDLVFNSHTIVYERSHPLREGRIDFEQGIVYIVAGGAGAMPEWLLPKREWHTSQSLAVPHFVQVIAAADRLEVRAIDADGRLFDSFYMRILPNGQKFLG